jgi:uncharacterized protein YkwD
MPPERNATRDSPDDARARLISIGSSRPREYPLDKPTITIGSHRSNDVVIDDTTVSRRHATITHNRGRFELTDLSSTNGTFVNGGRVRGSIALGRGDEVRFGSARYRFATGANPATSALPVRRSSLRLGRALILIAAMFLGGFAAVRYRSEIGPAASAIIAWISTRQPTSAPSAANTQSLSANASPEPTEVSTPAPEIPVAAEPGWLRRVNYYRAMAKLPPLVEDPALSSGDLAHATYLVKNDRDKIEHGGLGAEMHTEHPEVPGFTADGLEAAKGSVMDEWYMPGGGSEVYGGAGTSDPDEWAAQRAPGSPEWSIDGWMSLPFHRMPLLNPRLATAGFGMFCESGVCAAGLNLLNGERRRIPIGDSIPPIEFPPDGATIAMRSFGNEWPDPRTSCPGYEPPSGLAITLQLGADMDSHLGAYSVSRENADGSRAPLDACGFDSTSYSNPDASTQQLGRNVLRNYATVVVIPRAPLAKGAKYAVSIVANGKQSDWTFSTRP